MERFSSPEANAILASIEAAPWTYRKPAAVLSWLVTGAMVASFIIIGLSAFRDGKLADFVFGERSFFSSGSFLALLTIYWVHRYSRPAIKALKGRGDAVAITGERLSFFGQMYDLDEIEGISIDSFLRKNVQLLLRQGAPANESLIFIDRPRAS